MWGRGVAPSPPQKTRTGYRRTSTCPHQWSPLGGSYIKSEGRVECDRFTTLSFDKNVPYKLLYYDRLDVVGLLFHRTLSVRGCKMLCASEPVSV